MVGPIVCYRRYSQAYFKMACKCGHTRYEYDFLRQDDQEPEWMRRKTTTMEAILKDED